MPGRREVVILLRASVRMRTGRELVEVWMTDFESVVCSFVRVSVGFDLEKDMSQCAPDSFIEVAAQWITAEKLNREFR